jgi:hypothetical protein
MPPVELEEYLSRRTLIVGEVNAGKSRLTQAVLHALCAQGYGSRTAVLDLAPEVPIHLAAPKGLAGVGGRLRPPAGCRVMYRWARPVPPRLTARTEAEALALAERNRLAIEALLAEMPWGERDFLVLNDVSIYLQAGDADRLVARWPRISTVVANGYYGARLGEGPLSRRERREMEELMKRVDRVIRLSAPAQ